ncbi:hypothetical protein [Desulfolucanica intricata]|uniref:hypothetical protein n=1 Tax=Desulfolucanica intricata TaxID=1285191 RepID=UPI00082CE2EC|nr:hypothetical protein [Desulfolucanica intricata]
MDITKKVNEIANNHDYFVGLTRELYYCEKCSAKAPATIFESLNGGINVTVLCCSSCGHIFKVETNHAD